MYDDDESKRKKREKETQHCYCYRDKEGCVFAYACDHNSHTCMSHAHALCVSACMHSACQGAHMSSPILDFMKQN